MGRVDRAPQHHMPAARFTHAAATHARMRAVVWSGEDAESGASTPTTYRDSRCTVRKGGTWPAE
eukprot:4855461-Pyramimonas_sp.AAC.1